MRGATDKASILAHANVVNISAGVVLERERPSASGAFDQFDSHSAANRSQADSARPVGPGESVRQGAAQKAGQSGETGPGQKTEFLVIKELTDGKASYNFPSGKAHLDEMIEQTARREVVEETGYEAELKHVVSVYYYRTKNNSNDRKKDRITVRFNFSGILKDVNQIQRPTKETVSLAWVSREELQKLIQDGAFRNWVARQLAEDALSNQRFPLGVVKQFKR